MNNEYDGAEKDDQENLEIYEAGAPILHEHSSIEVDAKSSPTSEPNYGTATAAN